MVESPSDRSPGVAREMPRTRQLRLPVPPLRPFELVMTMGFKTILVPIEQHDLMSRTLETALLLARKFDSYIEGFALRTEIPAAFAVADVAAVPIPAFEQDIAENDKRSRSLFENFMQDY